VYAYTAFSFAYVIYMWLLLSYIIYDIYSWKSLPGSDSYVYKFSSNMVDAESRLKGVEPSDLLNKCKTFLGDGWKDVNETNFEFNVLT